MATAARARDDELPTGLSVDTFLAWAKQRRGRYELHDGAVVLMAAERVGHASVKGAIYRTLGDAIARAGVPCRALPDGVAVRVSEQTWYEPDALVYCGPEAPKDDIEIPRPVIVVEVQSPSTAQTDEAVKLIGYFSLASIQHYLIVSPDGPPVIHFQRQGDGTILTRLVSGGPITLDPPGIEIDVGQFFA